MKNKPQAETQLEEKIKNIVERIENVSEARVYSPYLLSEEEKQLLIENFGFLKDKRVTNIVNKELIAGLIIETDDQVVDLSLRSRLNRLKNLLYEAIS